jgi:diaminohydroxyphosphoribosylaminopyrimidine deaminase/5-amino-6-(5-phosphoribosylamino)uracil reductase
MSTKDNNFYMLRALELAQKGYGMVSPNPMVGACIVRNDVIIGEGYHHQAGMPHAEIEALNDAKSRNEDITGSTMYVTLEPCSTWGRTPPCCDAIIKHKIKKVVIGTLDPNPEHAGRGVEILQAAGIEVIVNVKKAACDKINEVFFKWITTKRPFVILKMAQTLDGKIATFNGNSQWITSSIARERVQEIRRGVDAIMVGTNTVIVDKPSLTVRIPENWPKQPKRLIATNSLSSEQLKEVFPDGNFEKVDVSSPEKWEALLTELGNKKITSLLIEGGGELAASAVNANIVDYVEFHIAPKLLGGRDSRTSLAGENPSLMAMAKTLKNVKVETYGNDVAISGYF